VRRSIDLTVRVPAADLRGVDPARVTISVHEVQEHPSTALAPFARLAEQPALKLAPQASVTLNQVELPSALRSLMATR
jgi:hypothetical protein